MLSPLRYPCNYNLLLLGWSVNFKDICRKTRLSIVMCRRVTKDEFNSTQSINLFHTEARLAKHYLPIIFTMEERCFFPKLLSALQVYFPPSSISASLIMRVLSSAMLIVSPSVTCTPSFSQVTDGVGTPLTGHLMVMVVFEAAVTLSPMFMVTGLPSPAGISRPGSGTSIAGLVGSVQEKSSQRPILIVQPEKVSIDVTLMLTPNNRTATKTIKTFCLTLFLLKGSHLKPAQCLMRYPCQQHSLQCTCIEHCLLHQLH